MKNNKQENISSQTETKPTDTESTKTESAETESAETESAETKSAETKSAETESAETESTETESAETESADTESTETESAETESADTESTDTESAETESTDTESTDTESAETESTDTKSKVEEKNNAIKFKLAHEVEKKKSFSLFNPFGFLFRLWKNRYKLNSKKEKKNFQQFFPPSLEVLESPPHPAPRILLAITVAVFLTAIIWSCVGKINIITVAEGKIIPGSKIKQIQPYERGVVLKIWVQEGQLVQAGDPLIELDKTQTDADTTRLIEELDFIERSYLRRKALVLLLQRTDSILPTWLEIEKLPELEQYDISEKIILYEEWRALTSQVASLESQLLERQAEKNTSQEIINQFTATIPLIEQRVNVIKKLFDKEIATLAEYLSLEEERLRQTYSLAAEKSRFEQVSASINTVKNQIDAQKSQNLSQALIELEDFKRQKKSLKQELTKAEDLNAKQLLLSPVTGTIKGLEINTIGGVVTPAQILMEIVPWGEVLEVEAFVNNQDIGYIIKGQSAEVKINTFPFTKYGIINGVVESVAQDATIDENKGLIYRTRLILEKSTLMVDGKETQLMPGMAVSAEISTGKRRLIEFFLAPLLRIKDESMRER